MNPQRASQSQPVCEAHAHYIPPDIDHRAARRADRRRAAENGRRSRAHA